MRRLLPLLVLASSLPVLSGSARPQRDDCPEPAEVYGRIQVVENFADCEVEVVESFQDLRVRVVDAFPDSPGEWKIVESFPDYTVTFVESFPDFTIRYVESFPGADR